MNLLIHQEVLSPKQVQIKKLTKIALIMSSVAALPGLIASAYPAYYLFISIVQGPDGNNWTVPLVLVGLAIVGWWLYWTYWLEYGQKNKHGKVTWLVSALFNSIATVFLTGTLFASSMTGIGQYMFVTACILFLATMMFISFRIWIFKVKS